MKKACLENGEFHIRNICMKDYQTINNDEVLIEVKYASICGSDRSTVKNIDSTNKKDLILGHEYSGVVIKAGKNVPSSVVGNFYNIQPNIHCETCIDCKKKNYSLCKNKLSYGVNLPGGYSQLSVVKFNNIVEIGDLNTKYSSVLEPISCCIRAIDRCGLHNTNNVLILGSGFTGLLMIKIIKSLKSSVDIDVIELCSFKKEVAKNIMHDLHVTILKN